MEIGNLVGMEFFEGGKTLKVINAKLEGNSVVLTTEETGKIATENKNKKICVIIGHGGNDCGAVSQDKKTTELGYNTALADELVELLESNGYEAFTHNRGYSKMENTTLINSLNPDLIVSLHCNSANTTATGTEAIYYPGSVKGKKFAELLCKNVSEALGLKNRGAKEPFHGRGSGLLRSTKATCVISEPYFISNDSDLKIALEKKNEYAEAILKSIDEYFGLNTSNTDKTDEITQENKKDDLNIE